MTGTVPVTFVPSGRTVWVVPGTTVLLAARKAGIVIPAPCGGAGRCGKCAIRVVEGVAPESTALEARGIKLAPKGMRLACLLAVEAPLTVRPLISQPTRSPADIDVQEPGRELLAAVDLGTTSVHAVVIDAESGLELGRSSTANEQQSWGSDLIARVGAAVEGNASELTAAAEDSILTALELTCGSAGGCLRNITRVVISGNTVMTSLLLGDDVSAMAEAPYMAPSVASRVLESNARIIGQLAPGAESIVLPAVAGFVGGDLAAGIAVSGLFDSGTEGAFMDLGTNAEIAVLADGEVSVASAAAGPAFEGYGITCGGPAVRGAIERVQLVDGGLVLEVIGGTSPMWLCGSGLVSVIRLLRDSGHISADGKMNTRGPLADRFTEIDGVVAIDLADSGGSHVVLTQIDVRTFQLAKGAVAAGLALVARNAGFKPHKHMEIVLAGAFGSALDPDDLVDLGVLPQEASGRIRAVGNTSLLGAAMVAVRPDVVERIESISAQARHVELATDPRFKDAYLASMALEPYSLRKRIKRAS